MLLYIYIITDFRGKIGIFDEGPFNVIGIDFDCLLREFDPSHPWRFIQDIENRKVAKVAKVAISLMSKPIHIVQLEKFHRSFTHVMAHNRQRLAPSHCDRIVTYKYDSAQLRKHFGFK